jgi:CSLREA domain-containing protein
MLLAPSPAHASTTFTVNTPYDTKDGNLQDNHCDVATFIGGDQCTLRAAIEQANATLGADAIRFNIPDSFGAGAKTIHVGSTTPSNGALPDIDEALTINGYTQPGAHPNAKAVGNDAALKVELSGASTPDVSGLLSRGCCPARRQGHE